MSVDTSQRPIRDGWLALFLAECREGEVVLSGHWYGERPSRVLTRLWRLIHPYSPSALLVRWLPAEGCYLLLLRMEELSASLSTRVMSGREPTVAARRSLLRLLLPYGGTGEFRLYLVGSPPVEDLKEALRTI